MFLLQKLRIDQLGCNVLDLKQAKSSTSVELLHVHCQQLGRTCIEATFPTSLQSLAYITGNELFYATHGLQLEHCCQLTELVMCAGLPKRWRAFKPILPSGLRHLVVKQYNEESWVDVYDWRCLSSCINLERLTLPRHKGLSKRRSAVQLQAWVFAARHLHVVDYEVPQNVADTPNQVQCNRSW